jgi:hypothetical protein
MKEASNNSTKLKVHQLMVNQVPMFMQLHCAFVIRYGMVLELKI